MKVTYMTDQGYISKAYLNDEPVEEGIYAGTNKHTDEEVRVKWSDELHAWIQIKKELG